MAPVRSLEKLSCFRYAVEVIAEKVVVQNEHSVSQLLDVFVHVGSHSLANLSHPLSSCSRIPRCNAESSPFVVRGETKDHVVVALVRPFVELQLRLRLVRKTDRRIGMYICMQTW